ncbi:MAG: Rne/Rng family ribonuclease [Thermodesulfobacteriota bacterium]|nr:Rne/Rng family ribonuclease [Thermodesulfobacteriota bacterium]
MTQKKERHQILINAIDPEECRVAVIKGTTLEDFSIETASGELNRGNIYKGVITRAERSLQAAFVDYGAEKNGFLQQHEIHSDYYVDKPAAGKKKSRSIQHLIKPGQELLVQVTKEPILTKGALLTTYISLAGRYAVLMPGGKGLGISRKIEEEKERQRLKGIMESLNIPETFGAIVRTAGKERKKRELSKDVRYLLRLWDNVKKKGLTSPAPCLLYKERHLAIRAIRDRFTTDVDEILVDDKDIYRDVKDFMRIISPRHAKIVKPYKDPQPIFTKYALENQIASIFASRVPLKSGGHIVINPTEALVAIDVNSGKSTRGGSLEKTAHGTNMEAAAEIARQLRLRDLGGLIVIDFIDMRERKHNQDVIKAVKEHTKLDKARISVGGISKFGLMELVRQRISASIEYGSFVPCPHCHGKGLLPSAERLALEFLRKLRSEILKKEVTTVKGIVPMNVADYLLNKKRKELLEVETRRNLTITIEGAPDLQPDESHIKTA